MYAKAVPAAEAGGEPVHDDVSTFLKPLRFDQEDYVRARCQANDGPSAPHYWKSPISFRDRFYTIPRAQILTHTGQIVDESGSGLVGHDTTPYNRNFDKPAILQVGDPIEKMVIPARYFTSNFHFMMDVAAPIVSLFESNAVDPAEFTILSCANDKPFATETLRAISENYGVELRTVSRREKIRVKAALFIARDRPCSDWYPIRTETAGALRSMLLTHFKRQPADPRGRGLYLRRAPSKMRNLHNASEVESVAASYGLVPFEPSLDNFADQVALIASAGTILAVHGASLTNLIFARPDAKVVEVFAEDGCKSVYLAMSHMLGLEHHHVIGARADATQSFGVDVAVLKRALDLATNV